MRRAILLAAAAAALLLGAAPPAPKIARIRAQLFYEGGGRLSRDLLAGGRFDGWNTIIGEGPAEEPANDLLVTVELAGADPETGSIAAPLTIVARSKSKLLGQRRFAAPLLSTGGRLAKPLWLSDVGCAGGIDIVATLGRSVSRAHINLDCGE